MDCYKCDLIEPMDLSLLIVFDPHILPINIDAAFDLDGCAIHIYRLNSFAMFL